MCNLRRGGDVLEDLIRKLSVLLVEFSDPFGSLGDEAQSQLTLIEQHFRMMSHLGLVVQQGSNHDIPIFGTSKAIHLSESPWIALYHPPLHWNHRQLNTLRINRKTSELHGSLRHSDEFFMELAQLHSRTIPPTTADSVKEEPFVQIRRFLSITQEPPLKSRSRSLPTLLETMTLARVSSTNSTHDESG